MPTRAPMTARKTRVPPRAAFFVLSKVPPDTVRSNLNERVRWMQWDTLPPPAHFFVQNLQKIEARGVPRTMSAAKSCRERRYLQSLQKKRVAGSVCLISSGLYFYCSGLQELNFNL